MPIKNENIIYGINQIENLLKHLIKFQSGLGGNISSHSRMGGNMILLLLCFALCSSDLLPLTLYIFFNSYLISFSRFLPCLYCLTY